MNSSDTPNAVHLKQIQQAITQQRVVQMQYFSPGSGEFTERSIEPVSAVRHSNAWLVIAYCQLRQDFRNFRLDRMSKLSVSKNTYAPHDVAALEAYLKRQLPTGDEKMRDWL